MEGVDQIDALVIGRRRRSCRRSGRRCSAPAAAARPAPSTWPSGTPVHLPIALQPSTQSWRVICVRAGIACSSASEQVSGAATSPSTRSRQSAKPVCGMRGASPPSSALVLPLVRNTGDISRRIELARERLAPPISRWTRYESHSPLPSTSSRKLGLASRAGRSRGTSSGRRRQHRAAEQPPPGDRRPSSALLRSAAGSGR